MPPIWQIILKALDHYGVDFYAFYSNRKHDEQLLICRRVVWWLGRHVLRLTWEQLGWVTGKDHSTVVYGARKVNPEEIPAELRTLAESLIAETKAA